jgi:hypothetical protein
MATAATAIDRVLKLVPVEEASGLDSAKRCWGRSVRRWPAYSRERTSVETESEQALDEGE